MGEVKASGKVFHQNKENLAIRFFLLKTGGKIFLFRHFD